MKKSFLLILALSFALGILAQRPGFQIGLTGTMDQYNFSYHPCSSGMGDTAHVPCGSSLQAHDNFGIGAVFQWRTGDRSFLRVRPTYCSKGFAVQYNSSFTLPGDPFIVTSTEVHIYYVDLPILTGFRVLEKRRFGLVGMAGPVPGFRLWDREASRFALGVQRDSDVLDLDYSQMLVGMHGEAGLEVRLDPFVVVEAGAWTRWYPTPVVRQFQTPDPMAYGFSVTVLVNFPNRRDRDSEAETSAL